MEYWDSAEAEKNVYANLVDVQNALRSQLTVAMRSGRLDENKTKFCYIPIVMGADFADLYPPRSKYDRKEEKVFHSPVLNYELFRKGTVAEMKSEYLGGILLAEPVLRAAGLDPEQMLDFISAIEQLKI